MPWVLCAGLVERCLATWTVDLVLKKICFDGRGT
jgi:hypothetical protein